MNTPESWDPAASVSEADAADEYWRGSLLIQVEHCQTVGTFILDDTLVINEERRDALIDRVTWFSKALFIPYDYLSLISLPR